MHLLKPFALCLLVVFVAACSGRASTEAKRDDAFAELRAGVSEIVTDESRAAQVLTGIDGLESSFKNAKAEQVRFHDRLRDLNLDYQASPEQFDALLDETDAVIEAIHSERLEYQQMIHQAMTEDEWEELANLRTEAFERALKEQQRLSSPGQEG